MMTKKTLLTIGCTAAVAVAALSSALIFSGCNKKGGSESSAADVLEPMTEPPTEPAMPEIKNFSAENGLTGRAKVLLRENEDVVGYIRISNTNIDYPVLQYDGEDLEENGNDYYLHRDIYGNYFEPGTIFMDYRDVFDADESKHSENIVLYGHNMLSGAMFADLHKYRQDESFYDENPIIEFSSNYKDYQYIIFAYFVTSGSYGDSAYGDEFAYWDMEDLSNEKDFNNYLEVVKDRSYISPDIDVKPDDDLLTLSTCYMDEDNSRMLVVARRLRDNETLDKIDKAQGSGSSSSDADDSEEEQEEDQ